MRQINAHYVLDAEPGDSIVCPGCQRVLTLDATNGWRDFHGYGCSPARTVHTDHIVTLDTRANSENPVPCITCGEGLREHLVEGGLGHPYVFEMAVDP